MRLETLTHERKESVRLDCLRNRLKNAGHFSGPVFPTPKQFQEADTDMVLSDLETHRARFESLAASSRNDTGYSFDNIWFTSPDAEVLYSMIRRFTPARIIEVGSGHSTRMARQAIMDSGGSAELISVDPDPRLEVAGFADVIHRQPFEMMEASQLTSLLRSGDILFIDSSHEIATGNDVVFALLKIIPALSPGVLIHIHDIFLPYDYPESWIFDRKFGWTEQYLVQALLMGGSAFEVIWPGHYVQRTRPELATILPRSVGRPALSLWMRVRETST